MTTNLMRAVAHVQALADATTMRELEQARLAAIKSQLLGYSLSPGEPTSDASMVLSECDPSWDGQVITLAAWVSRITARKVIEFGQADGTAARFPASLPVGGPRPEAQAGRLELSGQITGGDA